MADLTGMMQAAAGSAGGAVGGYIAVPHSSSPFFTLLDHTTPGTISLAATYTLAGQGEGVAFSPDGKYIAVGYEVSPRFTLLDHTTPGAVSLAATYTLGGNAFRVAFSPAI